MSDWDFKSFLAKNKPIVENPQRGSASLTSGGRAPLLHVSEAGLQLLLSLAVIWGQEGLSGCSELRGLLADFLGPLREKHRFYFRIVPVFTYQ